MGTPSKSARRSTSFDEGPTSTGVKSVRPLLGHLACQMRYKLCKHKTRRLNAFRRPLAAPGPTHTRTQEKSLRVAQCLRMSSGTPLPNPTKTLIRARLRMTILAPSGQKRRGRGPDVMKQTEDYGINCTIKHLSHVLLWRSIGVGASTSGEPEKAGTCST